MAYQELQIKFHLNKYIFKKNTKVIFPTDMPIDDN